MEGDLPGVGGTEAGAEGGPWGKPGERKGVDSAAGTASQTEVEPTGHWEFWGRASHSSGASQAAPAARAYPVDLRQPPFLPGFEQAERFPSWKRQRDGPGSRGLTGPRAPGPAPASRAWETPRSAGCAQVAGGGHRAQAGGSWTADWGRGRGGQWRLP